jgi:hypothetical protein
LKIVIDPIAYDTLDDIASLIDGINTPGAGDRWIDKILDFIISYAKPDVQYALCHNTKLATELFSCIVFNNWVIVFRIEKETFRVYQIMHGSLLK